MISALVLVAVAVSCMSLSLAVLSGVLFARR